jgi:3-hydroxyisobutyrate dehydrogenase-like beta-hydroxyacid dehydrogenase
LKIRFALIGYGEAASAFALGASWGPVARAFDVKPDKAADYAKAGVTGCASLAEALAGVEAALSLVTADQCLAVAEAAARHIVPDALFFDMNSVAPHTKRAAAAVIDAAGGRYVDVAVMSPVYPAQMAVPLLMSGPYAAAGAASLTALGFSNVRTIGDDVGRASTIKMLRSVMYKGMEALTAECLLACQKAGVTDEVLGSFGNAKDSENWASGADYRLDRMMVHGLRRSAEMYESVKTLQGLGVEPMMTRGTAARQAEIGALGHVHPPEGLEAKLKLVAAHPEEPLSG